MRVLLQDLLLRFTVASFLIQLLLPFYAVYGVSQSHAATAAANPELFGEKVLICTRDGFQWVSWAQLAEDEATRNSQHRNLQCPTCYLQAKDMHADSVRGFVWQPLICAAARTITPRNQSHHAQAQHRTQTARAPPLS